MQFCISGTWYIRSGTEVSQVGWNPSWILLKGIVFGSTVPNMTELPLIMNISLLIKVLSPTLLILSLYNFEILSF